MDYFKIHEAEHTALVETVFTALNSLDTDALLEHFHEQAITGSMDDSYPGTRGREETGNFFRDFFNSASDISFELLEKPHVAGNLVILKQADRFQLDGAEHKGYWVSVLLIENGKIRKWLGQKLSR